MPTVLYCGNFLPEHSTENEIRRAFEAIGWTVDTVQEAAFAKAIARGAGRRTAIHDRALAADLVLHTMTQGSYPDPRRVTELWRLCANKGVPTASIHLDLFYGLSSRKETGPQRMDLPREHPMFRVAHVFTADGGHDAEFARDNVNHHWLPPGVSHTECVDVRDGRPIDAPLDTRILQDIAYGRYLVGFAGSDGYHPEWPHRPQLVAWLRETYKDRFLHIGGSSTPRITGLALNRVLASVPVWVGDSCLTRPDFAYWSDRVPETWGRGGYLIHPKVYALDKHYYSALPDRVSRVPSWTVGEWEFLEMEIDHALAYPDVREETRRALAGYTRRFDTYVQRVETMLDVIGFDRAATDA